MNLHTIHFGDLNSVFEKLEKACPYLFMEHFDLEKLDPQYLHLLGPDTSSLQLKDLQKTLIAGSIEAPILKRIIEIEINALSSSMNSYGIGEGFYTIPRLLNDSKDFMILSELSKIFGIKIPGLHPKVQEVLDGTQEHIHTLF